MSGRAGANEPEIARPLALRCTLARRGDPALQRGACLRSGATFDRAMPAVSVIMVFHVDTPFLRPAIDCVLRQTFREFELVLVDNGLGLPVEALGGAAQDARVRMVRLPADRGIGPAMSAGIAAARTDLIALCDSDDLMYPTRLERQVGALRADPGLGLVSARARRVDAEGRPLPGGVFTLYRPEDFLAYAQYAAPVINPLSTGRREIFTALPFRPAFPYASELDFQSRMVERWRVEVLPDVLMDYRWYPSQTTQRHGVSIDQSRCAIALLTARRRAGREEAVETVQPLTARLSAGAYARLTAAQCVTEGFPVPAAYLARRSFVVERSPRAAWAAFGLGAQAWRRADATQRGLVARMFLKGPVRALGVRPA